MADAMDVCADCGHRREDHRLIPSAHGPGCFGLDAHRHRCECPAFDEGAPKPPRALTTRDAFRARVADLLRRSAVDDAEELCAALDSFVLSDEEAAAVAFAFDCAKAPPESEATYLQIMARGDERKLSVGHIHNSLHGTRFTPLRVWGADL